MLLCASANRAKSWSCENCLNWKIKDSQNCLFCYWAFPDTYKHIAMRDVRRLDVMWTGEETNEYDEIKKEAKENKKKTPDYVKAILRKHLRQK